MRRERGPSLCVAVMLALASVTAFAEPLAENGIKIGDGRLHPYFDLEGRYDSAAGLFGPTATLGGEIIMRFRPGVKFELTSPATAINFNGNAEYVWYTGAISSNSRDASRFQTDIGLDAAFNKTGPIEFQIGDQLTRSDRTANPAIGIGVISLFNNARVAVPIHPGGGALEVAPRGAFQVEFFEPLLPGAVPGCAANDPKCQPTLLSTMNYYNIQVGLGAKYKFLPKTAAIFDAQLDFRNYFTAAATNRPATLFKTMVGMSGLITTKVSVVAQAGYGGEYLGSGAQTFIAQAEVGFLPNSVSAINIGYLRTLQPVPIYGTFGDDRGYLTARTELFDRLTLAANASIDFLTFYTAASRQDLVIGVGGGPTYRFTSWLSAALAYNLGLRTTSERTTPGIAFARHEVIARITVAY